MRVVVTTRDSPRLHTAELGQYGEVRYVSERSKSVIMDIPDENLKKIAGLPFVTEVVVDTAFKPAEAGQENECTFVTGMITNARARSVMGADTPFPAVPVRVAVIDTGIAETDRINVIKRLKVIDEETTNRDHGTWVAHTIAGYAVETNYGIAEGVTPGTPIIDAPVINPQGYTTMGDIIQALDMVADAGANVVNMSLSGPYLCTQAMDNMIRSVSKEGIIVVVAGGNFGNSSSIGCPANSPDTIAVGSVYLCDLPKCFIKSSFTPKGADIAAIGGDVKPEQLIIGLGMERPIAMAGTSMATPFVTGAAAVIKAYKPDIDVRAVRYILASSSMKPAKVPDPWLGYGVLNYRGILSEPEGQLNNSPYYPESVLTTVNPTLLYVLTIGGIVLWLSQRRNASPNLKAVSRY